MKSWVLVVGCAVALSACSGGPSAQEANAPITVQTSQLFITIQNKAGLALVDVDVAIVPVGGSNAYKKFIGRIENSEKRDLSLGEFSGTDGTPFSLRVVRPKSVRVTGKDVNDKSHTVEVPWQ